MDFEVIEKYNYWSKQPVDLGLIRDSYLETLEEFDKTPAMIVVSGARRAGKSILMKQFIKRKLAAGVGARNILYLNFFLRPLRPFVKEELFFKAVDRWYQSVDSTQKSYIIIDEVQELENWDEIAASLNEDHTIRSKIIITGSNSKLLAREATTKLSGRYYSMQVFPFSYEEFSAIKGLTPISLETFQEFINTPTTPEATLIKSTETCMNLLEGIVNTTIQKDIIERYNPSSPALLAKIIEYIRLNSSSTFAMKKIKDTLNNQVSKKDQIGLTKIEEYFEYAKTVYFCHECNVFSYRKKDILNRSNNKYYLNDWGMALFAKYFEEGRILENVIFMELLKKKYDVKTYYAYNNANIEIDFWATKQTRSLFIQVAWMLGDPNENSALYKREFGNLNHVVEDGEKLLVSMDKPKFQGSIRTMQPHEFILQL